MYGQSTPQQLFGNASLFRPGGQQQQNLFPGGQANQDLIAQYMQNRGGLMQQYQDQTLNRPGQMPGQMPGQEALPPPVQSGAPIPRIPQALPEKPPAAPQEPPILTWWKHGGRGGGHAQYAQGPTSPGAGWSRY